jgi:transposase
VRIEPLEHSITTHRASATPHSKVLVLIHAVVATEGLRLFAWFQNFRRIVVRYERCAENFLGMLHLACCLILLRGLRDGF